MSQACEEQDQDFKPRHSSSRGYIFDLFMARPLSYSSENRLLSAYRVKLASKLRFIGSQESSFFQGGFQGSQAPPSSSVFPQTCFILGIILIACWRRCPSPISSSQDLGNGRTCTPGKRHRWFPFWRTWKPCRPDHAGFPPGLQALLLRVVDLHGGGRHARLATFVAVLEKVPWVREYHGLGALPTSHCCVYECTGENVGCLRTCVIWVCISASPCQGHCSCSGSLSSHRAHLFPTWPPSLCSSPLPDVRNLKLTSQLQQLQVSSWQNLKGLRGGVGGDLQLTNPPPPDPRTKQQSRGDNWFTSLGTPWKDLKYITVWTEPVDLHLCLRILSPSATYTLVPLMPLSFPSFPGFVFCALLVCFATPWALLDPYMQIMSQDEYIGNNSAYLEQTDGMRPTKNIRGVQGQTTKQEAAWKRILNQAINLESGTWPFRPNSST